ncbi:MAG: hypothetical protein NVV59_08980 [Chitinophagaceae bacterium]|nr:hypothetical protein [Chitinophagaceae bacterium]
MTSLLERITKFSLLIKKSSEAPKSNQANNMNINRSTGTSRQQAELAQLRNDNPNASIQAERYLRDKNGKILKDPLTGEARRIDFAVIKDNKVIELVETTSLNANKTFQSQKEARIREAGGTYIRDRNTRKLIDVSNIETRISRRE